MKNTKGFKSITASYLMGLGFLFAMPFDSYAPPPPACTNTVQNTLDSGSGSLREALANASDGDTITFCPGVTGAITLTSGPLFVSSSVTILGPGSGNLAISRTIGGPLSGLFYITSNHIVTIAGLAITNGNVGGTFGGGIYNDHSTLTVSNCLVSGNSAADGGGIYNDGRGSTRSATLKVIASTLRGNLAVETGGAIYNDGQFAGLAIVEVTASTLHHNSANFDGGAIAHNISSGNGSVTIDNSTFSTNTASRGGAIVVFGQSALRAVKSFAIVPVVIRNSTLNGNFAPQGCSFAIFSSAVAFGSTILNPGLSGINIFAATGGQAFSDGYNLTSDATGFVSNIGDQTGIPVLLGPLQDNGGPTFTHAPLCNSPAIDKGKRFVPSSTDQRGAPRTSNIDDIPNATGGDGTDIGAVESPIFAFNVVNTSDSGAGSLRAAISNANASAGIDLIQFDPSAYGTIMLTNGELPIMDCLILEGPGATNVAINGNAASRVFHVNSNLVVAISGLTITNGGNHNPNFLEGSGAGILNEVSKLRVSDCVLSGNTAQRLGGGIMNYGSGGVAALTVINTTLSGNSGQGGGGIASSGGFGNVQVTIVNSTLSRNSAIQSSDGSGLGGGIFNDGLAGSATLILYNSTLNSNVAPVLGGAIFNSSGGTVQVGSTIFNANSIQNNGTGTSFGYNLSSDSGGGVLNPSTDKINTDPRLGPLQLNGGETPTHALLCESPAIDAGTNFLRLAHDQRGLPRTFDDPAVTNAIGGDGTDIGAFEAQIPVPCNQPPVAMCTNVIVLAATNCMADASIDNGSYDPDAGDSITNSVQSPAGPYSLGTNTVVLTVTDGHGASSSCTGFVFVVDTTPPIIHCPTNIMATNDSGQCSAVVNYNVTVDDNCSSVTLSEDYPSGSSFSKGTNTVTVTAVDLAGNTNTCSFQIIVLDKEAPLVMCRPAPNPSGKISEPGKGGTATNNPSGYYQLLAKDNCDSAPNIYIKDTGSAFVAGPFKDGDIVRLKHTGGAPSSVPGAAPVVAVINLKGKGLSVARDASGNVTPDSAGCYMQVSSK